MLLFGLTGGLGSGKSTVATHWRSKGLAVVDADELARVAVAPGAPALSQIVERFGPQMVLPSGALDRERLAGVVFNAPPQLEALNQIVHPEVARLANQHFEALAAAGHHHACYEVPLLFERGLQARYRPVVVVSAPREVCIERAVLRSAMTRAQAEARIDAQLPLETKRELADHVIDNSGTLEETLKQADEVLRVIIGGAPRSVGLQPKAWPPDE